MELRIPPFVSKILGGGFPCIGFNEIPFGMMAPSWLKSINFSNSCPYPNVPEAAITGFFNSNFPIQTDRSRVGAIFIIVPRRSLTRGRQGHLWKPVYKPFRG